MGLVLEALGGRELFLDLGDRGLTLVCLVDKVAVLELLLRGMEPPAARLGCLPGSVGSPLEALEDIHLADLDLEDNLPGLVDPDLGYNLLADLALEGNLADLEGIQAALANNLDLGGSLQVDLDPGDTLQVDLVRVGSYPAVVVEHQGDLDLGDLDLGDLVPLEQKGSPGQQEALGVGVWALCHVISSTVTPAQEPLPALTWPGQPVKARCRFHSDHSESRGMAQTEIKICTFFQAKEIFKHYCLFVYLFYSYF